MRSVSGDTCRTLDSKLASIVDIAIHGSFARETTVMQCPHCTREIHPDWAEGSITPKSSNQSAFEEYAYPRDPFQIETAWVWEAMECPACGKAIINVALVDVDNPDWRSVHPAYPRFPKRKPLRASIPENMEADYIEAWDVLPASAKASAALSRRVLQAILNDQGYIAYDLAKQVDLVLGESDLEKVLPSSIRNIVDAPRSLGNLAAHPTTDASGLHIVDVESNEAELCLEIIEALFVHYYGGVSDARVENLKAKLDSANKRSRLR